MLFRSKSNIAKTLTFSTEDKSADIYAYDIKAVSDGVEYFIDNKKFKLNVVGCFNVANALAAISACVALGLNKLDVANALEGFKGVKVRLEKIGKTYNNILVYNDFAHNPQKLKASIKALKEHDGRVIAMYQPHTPFSVTNTRKEMGRALIESLGSDDIFIMQEIYELTPSDSISSEHIIEDLQMLGHKNSIFFSNRKQLKNFILEKAQKNDKIVIMGAHDNSLADFSKELFEELNKA